MMYNSSWLTLAVTLIELHTILAAPQTWREWTDDAGLMIETNIGTIVGFINDTAPSVRQFLSIPYATPPTGNRRWLPPVPITVKMTDSIDATRFPPSCPQYATTIPSVYTIDVPEFVAVRTTEDQYQKTSEDCLSLAVWTPVGAMEDANLPVIMFMTGGGFITGGIDIGYQMPHRWVQRTQSHIVVTINYRLNIFGFPNAKGLSDQNLGILDQRMALEWVRDNIKFFGGDPSHITLWGQSAGAASVDYHNFAFPDDPIANAFFMDSGSAILNLRSQDVLQTNFSFVASRLGCADLEPEAEIDCMRQVDFQAIENFVGGYADNRSSVDPSLPLLRFVPVADELVIFDNYTERYRLNALSDRAALFTSNTMEGVSLVSYPVDPQTNGPNQTLAEETTLAGFTCPVSSSAMMRTAQGRTTYRWQYAGNFSNVSPLYWMGAYHSSDLAMIFGTHQDFRGPSTAFEFAVSEKIQDYTLVFMKDPVNGPSLAGWPSVGSGLLLRFGDGGQVLQTVNQESVDAPCDAVRRQRLQS